MSKEIVSGAGVRRGTVFILDANGLPMPSTASATPYTGVAIQGIKSTELTDAAPRRISHRGDDYVRVQDTLPSTELPSGRFTTSATNMVLDNLVSGTTTRSYTSSKHRAVSTDQKGDEPQVALFFYRQAMDADENSPTFGRLRQWNGRVFHSARVSEVPSAYGEAETDTSYEVTPTSVRYTVWNEEITTTNWGARRMVMDEGTYDYQPVVNTYRGNGTLTSFVLSHAPYDSDHLEVFVDGTLTTPSGVNTTNPAFTLGAAAANAKLVFAIIQTQNA